MPGLRLETMTLASAARLDRLRVAPSVCLAVDPVGPLVIGYVRSGEVQLRPVQLVGTRQFLPWLRATVTWMPARGKWDISGG
jgi:hypothetical protein